MYLVVKVRKHAKKICARKERKVFKALNPAEYLKKTKKKHGTAVNLSEEAKSDLNIRVCGIT